MRILATSLLAAVLCVAIAGCHPGPVRGRTAEKVGGTIAGLVSTTAGATAVVGRRVSAINVDTGQRYDATTNNTGGYTLQVPEGTYRLEVELRANEALARDPGQTHISTGDLDAGRNFEITVR